MFKVAHSLLSMYILSIGSNQGQRTQHLNACILALNHIGKVERCSSMYQTPSWGYDGNDYLNICVLWTPSNTKLSPIEILDQLQEIEYTLGRRRTAVQYTDRVIDIDIVSCGELTFKHPRLEIPHNKMHLRKFVLIPLAEIYPQFFHPILKQSVNKLLETCEDTGEITHYGKL